MKRALFMILLLAVLAVPGFNAMAQKQDAAQRAAELRSQLADVEAKEGELKLRLEQLDEDLKPESIERALAGVGSTRPEELREQRRRQLQIEKDSVVNQLGHLSKRRSSLESSIAIADALAYQQSAQGPVTVDELSLFGLASVPRWLLILVIALVAVIGIAGAALVVVRRRMAV